MKEKNECGYNIFGGKNMFDRIFINRYLQL